MSDRALATQTDTSIVERVVMQGDLSKLTPQERLEYYSQVCASMGLNPLTRPFDYINLHGKLTLYAKRDAADQLRKLHRISIDKPDVQIVDDIVMVSVTGYDKTGRRDSELGAVYLGKKQGDDKANCILKAITKAKRRLTLSIVGLGWLDETEVDTIPGAQHVYPPEQRAEIDDAAELAEARRERDELMTYVGDNIPDGPDVRGDAERAARDVGFDGIAGNAPPAQKPQTAKRSWPSSIIKAIVDAHLAKNPPNAVAMLNKSCILRTTDELEFIMTWVHHYRSQRTPEVDKTPDQAAVWADEQMPKGDN